MLKFHNCLAHNCSDGNLLVGDEYTALFDCGMAFYAKETIRKIKDILGSRPLDYIFATHSHYDHIGALPFFREEWPQLKLAASEIAAAALLKETPRRFIREMSANAAKMLGMEFDSSYDDNLFYVDIIVKDKDTISLGSINVEVLETPGHTRDSLSFFIPEQELFIVSETPGVLLPDGVVSPTYLTSCKDTINSIKRCKEINYKYLSLPHKGLVSKTENGGFFDRALEATILYRDFILKMNADGYDEETMLNSLVNKYYTGIRTSIQPREAFIVNARAAIACTLRENKQSGFPD